MSHIKSLINNLINQRTDEAELDLHNHLKEFFRSKINQSTAVAVMDGDNGELYKCDSKDTAYAVVKALSANGGSEAVRIMSYGELSASAKHAFDSAKIVTADVVGSHGELQTYAVSA